MDLSFISTAMAASPGQRVAGGSEALSSILLLVGFLLIFYFFLWRPQSKRSSEHKKLISNLHTGDEVMTTGGILGKITKISDDFVMLSVSENTELKMQKSSIAATLPKGTMKSI